MTDRSRAGAAPRRPRDRPDGPTGDAIEVRQVVPGEEHLLARIAPEVFDHEVTPEGLAAYLATPGHVLIVALAGGQVVGQCAGVVHRHPDARPSELYIDEVGVSPAWQRRGVATRMLQLALDLGKRMGCREAWLGTEPENGPALALYAGRGARAEPVTVFVFDLDAPPRTP